MRTRELVSGICGAAAVAMGVLAMGGAPRWSQALVALLVAGGLVPLVVSRRRLARLSPLVAVLRLAAALTLIQLVPLPSSVVAFLAPTGATLRDEGLAIADGSAWSTISMDPSATLRALVGFLALLGIAAIALRRAPSERGRFQLLAIVGLVCAAAALVVGVHAMFDEHRLYGLYHVRHSIHVLGPLLNLNHLGCLMAIGSVVGIGLAAFPRQPAWARAGWLVVSAACGGITLYTVSRGATLALLAGAFVCIAILVAQRFTSESPRAPRSAWTSSIPIAIVAACAVLLVIYSSSGLVEKKFAETSLDEWEAPTSKFAAWRSALTLLEESPWVGVGRGGFESSFTRIHPTSGTTVFSHVENEYLQAFVDWGIPGALALGVAGVWLAVVALRRWREGPLAASAIGGLVVVAAQSNVDFGVELLGLAIPVTLLVASIAYVPLRETPRDQVGRVRALRIAHIFALFVGALVLFTNITTTIDEDHETLSKGDVEAIAGSISRHPLDYYGYAVASELAFRRGDPNGVRLLNHALRLNPTHGGLHRIAARRLRRMGHLEQAAIEYGVALRFTKAPASLLKEIVSELPSDLAVRAIPTELSNEKTVLAALTDAGHADIAAAWLGRIVERRPNHARACELLIAQARERAEATSARQLKDRCAQVLADATTLAGLAAMLAKRGQHDEIIVLLEDAEAATGPTEQRLRASMMLCDAYRARQRWVEANSCLRKLDASTGVTPDLHAQIETKLELVRRESRASSPPPP